MKFVNKLLVVLFCGYLGVEAIPDPCSSLKNVCEVGQCVGSAVTNAISTFSSSSFKTYTHSIPAISKAGLSVHTVVNGMATGYSLKYMFDSKPGSPQDYITITNASDSNCKVEGSGCGDLLGVKSAQLTAPSLQNWAQCLLERQNTAQHDSKLFIQDVVGKDLSKIKELVKTQYSKLGISRAEDKAITKAATNLQSAIKALEGWAPAQCQKVTVKYSPDGNASDQVSFYRWRNALPATSFYNDSSGKVSTVTAFPGDLVYAGQTSGDYSQFSLLSIYGYLLTQLPIFGATLSAVKLAGASAHQSDYGNCKTDMQEFDQKFQFYEGVFFVAAMAAPVVFGFLGKVGKAFSALGKKIFVDDDGNIDLNPSNVENRLSGMVDDVTDSINNSAASIKKIFSKKSGSGDGEGEDGGEGDAADADDSVEWGIEDASRLFE